MSSFRFKNFIGSFPFMIALVVFTVGRNGNMEIATKNLKNEYFSGFGYF